MEEKPKNKYKIRHDNGAAFGLINSLLSITRRFGNCTIKTTRLRNSTEEKIAFIRTHIHDIKIISKFTFDKIDFVVLHVLVSVEEFS